MFSLVKKTVRSDPEYESPGQRLARLIVDGGHMPSIDSSKDATDHVICECGWNSRADCDKATLPWAGWDAHVIESGISCEERVWLYDIRKYAKKIGKIPS